MIVMNISVVEINTSSPEYKEVFDLREEILRKPIGLSLHNEDLSRDHTDIILAGRHEGRVVACLMLHNLGDGVLQLRQMAVYPEYQGRGAGRALVKAAEELARERGYTKMILHARKTALGFYASMHYTMHGEEFMEVGIPHYHMEKALAKR